MAVRKPGELGSVQRHSLAAANALHPLKPLSMAALSLPYDFCRWSLVRRILESFNLTCNEWWKGLLRSCLLTLQYGSTYEILLISETCGSLAAGLLPNLSWPTNSASSMTTCSRKLGDDTRWHRAICQMFPSQLLVCLHYFARGSKFRLST